MHIFRKMQSNLHTIRYIHRQLMQLFRPNDLLNLYLKTIIDYGMFGMSNFHLNHVIGPNTPNKNNIDFHILKYH